MDQLSSTWITQAVQTWLSSGSGMFLSEGHAWLRDLAIIMLVALALRWALDAMSGGSSAGIFGSAGTFLVRLVIATFMLHYYNTPMPWCGVSFSGLLPDTAATLAAKVDHSATASVMSSFHQIESAAMPSMPWHALEVVEYTELLLVTLCMRGLLFLLDNSGFITAGIGVALGSLSIPFFVTGRLSWLFWHWLSFMIAASMFQVVGAVLGSMWSHILLMVMNHFFKGDYSVVDAAKLVAPFVALNFCMAFTCLGLGKICASLYGGAAASFDGFGSTLLSSVKGIR